MNYDSIPTEQGIVGAFYGELDDNSSLKCNHVWILWVGYTLGPLPTLYVDLHGLEWEVIEALKSLHETWSGGISLQATLAYGVRLYQHGASLAMHVVTTRVISSIIHVAHEYDDSNEPWPLHIEDHDGILHTIVLNEGKSINLSSTEDNQLLRVR